MTAHAKRQHKAKPKILVVEDDRLFSDIYAAKLEEEGFEAFMATDGEEGMHLLLAHKPDVILLDIILPKVTGLEMLEKIRAHEDSTVRDVPVIVVTNLNQDTYVDKMRAFGVKGYFIKSDVLFSQVLEKIRAIVG